MTPDLPDSELEDWVSAPADVDLQIGADLRGSDFEGEQRGKQVETLPGSPSVTVSVWGASNSDTAVAGDPCIRNATRPALPTPGMKSKKARSKVAQLKAVLSATTPVPIPRAAPTTYSVEKRRPPLTKRAIAKAAWPCKGKQCNAKDIAEQLRNRYQLTVTEHHHAHKMVCRSRAAFRMMAEQVRKECPTFIKRTRDRHMMVESIMDIIKRVEDDSSGVDEQ